MAKRYYVSFHTNARGKKVVLSTKVVELTKWVGNKLTIVTFFSPVGDGRALAREYGNVTKSSQNRLVKASGYPGVKPSVFPVVDGYDDRFKFHYQSLDEYLETIEK